MNEGVPASGKNEASAQLKDRQQADSDTNIMINISQFPVGASWCVKENLRDRFDTTKLKRFKNKFGWFGVWAN